MYQCIVITIHAIIIKISSNSLHCAVVMMHNLQIRCPPDSCSTTKLNPTQPKTTQPNRNQTKPNPTLPNTSQPNPTKLNRIKGLVQSLCNFHSKPSRQIKFPDAKARVTC